MSWSLWFNIKKIEVVSQWFLGKGSGEQWEYGFGVKNDGFISASIWQLNGVGHAVATSTSAISINNWYHMVVVYDSSGTNLHLYINGVLNATDTSFVGTIGNGNQQLRIGARQTSEGDVNGKIGRASCRERV